MKKTTTAILFSTAISFFFSLEAPTDLPHVKSKTEYAGFKSAAECEGFRSYLKELFEAFDVRGAKFAQCARRDDA